MTRIVVDPEALAGAGRAVTAVGDELATVVGSLSSSLGSGAPSGLDAAGWAFGIAYQTSAQALLDAGAALANASRNVGFGVGMSATNYSQADAASTIGGGAAPLAAPQKPVTFDGPSCPSSLGGGVMAPFLWSLLENVIPDSWPDGDPGRLRASAQAWQSFASSIGGIDGELNRPSGVMGAQQIPEGAAMASAMSELTHSASTVATEAGNLATQTGEFADDVQSTQDAIRALCDRISPSGIFDAITAVFSGDALDEVKEIAHDVQKVLENFGRQVEGRIALMQTLITGLDDAVVSLQQGARREFTHYLGEDVGGGIASAFAFQTNVGEGVLTAGMQTIVGIQQLDPTRFASDPQGAATAWGGVLDTLKYATPQGLAMDPGGALQHGKDMLGGIVHAEDWRADRPGLGLGGVLFEAGSAATGVGAAKTGLRGVTAAADASEEGAAVRAVSGATEGTAPIAGRVSEITGTLEDLTTLGDDVASGATPGTHAPTLPPSLAEPNVPRIPETPRPSETATPQGVPDSTGPRPTPEVTSSHAPDTGPARAPEPSATPAANTAAASEGSPPSFAPPHAADPAPSMSTPEPATVGAGGGAAHAAQMPSPEASHGPTGGHPPDPPPPSSVAPESHSNAPHEETPHHDHDESATGGRSTSAPDDGHGSHGDHSAHHDSAPNVAGEAGRHDPTVRTEDLHHPSANLLDGSELDAASQNPTRVIDALAEGLTSSDPRVTAIVPEDFDKYGGLGRDGWEERYWPSGETDGRGNPSLAWPDPDSHPEGFLSPEDRRPAVLEPGSTFDRFGSGFGRFVSPEGTPFPERGLPFSSLDDGYHRYEVVKELPAWQGPIAPAMGQPGGGIQYYLPYPVVDLILAGYIREVT